MGVFFCFKQKTADEMRISDWSSDVCSSDLWECLQYLVREHEKGGITYDTALLLKRIGEKAEAVKDLAYCLYDICANKRQDAKEATAYNALIADWNELTRADATIPATRGDGRRKRSTTRKHRAARCTTRSNPAP